jgi:hypothetical protein
LVEAAAKVGSNRSVTAAAGGIATVTVLTRLNDPALATPAEVPLSTFVSYVNPKAAQCFRVGTYLYSHSPVFIFAEWALELVSNLAVNDLSGHAYVHVHVHEFT